MSRTVHRTRRRAPGRRTGGPAGRLLGAATTVLITVLITGLIAVPTLVLASIGAPAAAAGSGPAAGPAAPQRSAGPHGALPARTAATADDEAVPVSGSDRPGTTGPRLEPGRYVDTFARGGRDDAGAVGTTKYYVIDARPGVHPYISVTLSPPDSGAAQGRRFGVEVTLLDSTGGACATIAAEDVSAPGRNRPVIAVLNGPVFGGPDAGPSCPTDEPAVLQVDRFGDADADRPLEAEIVVRMEPPADVSGLPGPATEGVELPTPAHGAPVDLTGGETFDRAPTLTPGTTYRDTVGTGENRYYRIPLGWEQRLAYSITEVGPADPLLGPGGVEVTADVFNPVREVDGFAGTGSVWFGSEPGASLGADTDYPVRYTNRDGVLPAVYSLDGDYYLRLSADRSPQPSRTDFVLTVAVDGSAGTGPRYLTAGSGGSAAGSTAGSGTGGSAPGSTRGPGATGVVAGATGPTAQAEPVPGGIPAAVWWVAGAVAVIGAALLVWWVRRRPDQAVRQR